MKKKKKEKIEKTVDMVTCRLRRINSRELAHLFNKLKKYGPQYNQIMGFSGDISKEIWFQRLFNSLYKLRLRRRPRDEYRAFYDLFQKLRKTNNKKKHSLKDILQKVHHATNKWHYSFSTKILHTLDDTKPIYDSRIGKLFDMTAPIVRNCYILEEHYGTYIQVIKKLLKENDVNKILAKLGGELADFKKISSVKKLDFVLWR